MILFIISDHMNWLDIMFIDWKIRGLRDVSWKGPFKICINELCTTRARNRIKTIKRVSFSFMLTWTQLWAMLSVLLTSDRIMRRSIQSQMWDIFIPDIPDSSISVEHCLQLRDDVYVKFAGVWLKMSSNGIAEDGWCYATSICSAGVP